MQIVIDDGVFVLAFGLRKFDFLLGVCKAELDDVFAIGSTTAEAAFEFLFARWQNENASSIGVDFIEVDLSENIEVEQYAVSFGKRFFNETLGRSVVVAVNFVPFN